MHIITTMEEAESYLSLFYSSKWTYTLDRMRTLMQELGNPQSSLRVIHVGGTAGKGSTCSVAAAILRAAGYRVGLHTSPHLISVTERLNINGQPISEQRFIQILNEIKPIADRIKPTYYEITVAMMFKYFHEEQVDIAIVEVGLGGRLDGTNVLTPVVSVITNVGLDHTEILGNTVEKIATDKREIIKYGTLVVSGVTQPTVQKLIMEKSSTVHSQLFLLKRDFSIRNLKFTDGVSFDYVSPDITIRHLEVSLIGRHQAVNAALAITAVLHCGLTVPEDAIRSALTSTRISGRLEIKDGLLIDGAHNPMKMTALARALTDYYPTKTFPVLFAAKSDKNVAQMVRILKSHVSHWYVTHVSRQTDWGKSVMYTTPDLAQIVSGTDPGKPVTVIDDCIKFLNARKNSDVLLLITGSLYLVGAVLEWKKNHPVK